MRVSYTERVLRDMDRANPHYARTNSGRFFDNGDRLDYVRDQRRSPPPILTVTTSREEQRGFVPPQECLGPYGSYARFSETPPPRLPTLRVAAFDETFRDVPPLGMFNDDLWCCQFSTNSTSQFKSLESVCSTRHSDHS